MSDVIVTSLSNLKNEVSYGNYHTLLITEEHVGRGPAPGREVALKGDMP